MTHEQAARPSSAVALMDLSAEISGLCSTWSEMDAKADLGAAAQPEEDLAEREAQRRALVASLEEGIGGLDEENANLRAALRQSGSAVQAEAASSAELHAALQAAEARSAELEKALQRAEMAIKAEAAKVQQANALSSGARLKVGKLDDDLKKATARAEAAEGQLAMMERRAGEAEFAAMEARRVAASEVGPAHQQIDAERKARHDAEQAAAATAKKLEAALKACRQAGDECERVRKRNDQLEREVETLRRRLGEQQADDAGGPTSIKEVFDDLAAMERLVNRSLDAGLEDTTAALQNAKEKSKKGSRQRSQP